MITKLLGRLTHRRPVCPTCSRRRLFPTRCPAQRLALAQQTRELRLRSWTAPDDTSTLTDGGDR